MPDEQLPLPGMPEVVLPEWFRNGTPTHIKNVTAGRHPLGLPLHPDAEARCGNCANLYRNDCGSRVYLKCGKYLTRGPYTDVRSRWRGCTEWVSRRKDG